MLVKVMAD